MFGRQSIFAATIVAMTMAAPASVSAQAWTQVGVLNCTLAPSVGLIVVAEQRMSCRFTPSTPTYPAQGYAGLMTTVGIDIGAIAGGALAWAVFSPTSGAPAGGLAGTYVGASGEITVAVGGGANILVGGSARSIALQPFSVEGTAGLNIQLGVSSLVLTPAP